MSEGIADGEFRMADLEPAFRRVQLESAREYVHAFLPSCAYELAEPIRTILKHTAALEVTNRELVRERDEARAEVERLNQECQVEIAFKVQARALAELRLAQVNEVSKGVADVLKTSWDLAAVCRDLLDEAEVTLSALRDSGSDLSELGALVTRAKAVLEGLKVRELTPAAVDGVEKAWADTARLDWLDKNISAGVRKSDCFDGSVFAVWNAEQTLRHSIDAAMKGPAKS